MGAFDFLKPKKPVELPLEHQRWNRMWDLWAKGELDSPYASLMTYQSEVRRFLCQRAADQRAAGGIRCHD